MTGLILKDFLNLKKQIVPLLFFIAIYVVIAVVSENASFYAGMVMIFSAMLPVSACSYDERSGFNKYALTMPVSRKDLVLSKYAMSLILVTGASCTSFLCFMLVAPRAFTDNLLSTMSLAVLAVLIISVSLPFVLKFGAEKGRYIMIGVSAFAGAAIALFALNLGTAEWLVNLLTGKGFFLLLIVLCCGSFILSAAISTRIYKNKDL